ELVLGLAVLGGLEQHVDVPTLDVGVVWASPAALPVPTLLGNHVACARWVDAERLRECDDQELLRFTDLLGRDTDRVADGARLVLALVLALNATLRATAGLLHDVSELMREQVPAVLGAGLVFPGAEVHVVPVRERARSELSVHPGGVAAGVD